MGAWSPLILVACVVGLYFLFQHAMGVNDFAYVVSLADDQMTPGTEWQAQLAAARTQWATSIFVGAVLMTGIAGLSFGRICRARPPRSGWALIGVAVALVWIVFCVYIKRITPVFGRQEMQFVAVRSSFDPAPRLGVVLAGLFSTALLLATALSLLMRSLVVRPLKEDLEWLSNEQRTLRTLLWLTTVWLANGVIGVGLLHRMGSAAARSEVRQTMDTLGASGTIFQGAFFSALLAAVFAPVEVAIRKAALSFRPVDVDDSDAWLEKKGFGGSLAKALLQILAIFGPLLTGVFQNLAQLK